MQLYENGYVIFNSGERVQGSIHSVADSSENKAEIGRNDTMYVEFYDDLMGCTCVHFFTLDTATFKVKKG